jgi:hypothetical protein
MAYDALRGSAAEQPAVLCGFFGAGLTLPSACRMAAFTDRPAFVK